MPISDYVTGELDEVLHTLDVCADGGSTRQATMKLAGIVSVLAREIDAAGKHRHAIVEKVTALENRVTRLGEQFDETLALANRLAEAVQKRGGENAKSHTDINGCLKSLAEKVDGIADDLATMPRPSRPAGFGQG